jgi:probable HAF family extracellular repeat protein
VKRFLCSLVALGLLQGITGQVKAQPSYSFTTLDVPGSSSPIPETQAFGINDSGQILGYYVAGDVHGFLLDNGSCTTVDPPGSTDTWAIGINASGQIVGTYYAAGTSHGFLLNNGTYTTIDVPGSIYTVPHGINDSGQIVGYYQAADNAYHGFLLDNGSYTTVDAPGSRATSTTGINASGQIVGSYSDDAGDHAFLLNQGSYTTVDVPGALDIYVSGINASGQIVGFYHDAAGTEHGFLLENGSYITLDVPGVSWTGAYGINDSGQIVGSYSDDPGPGGTYHGFVLDHGNYTALEGPKIPDTVATGINASGQIVGSYVDPGGTLHGFLLDNGSYTTLDVPGSTYTSANGINDLGQIVGWYSDAANSYHGFLLDNGSYTTLDVPGATSTYANGINDSATVSLIDCDSFQIRSNGRLYTCEVGVPEYTPPELQGLSFRGIERTPNHDCFGLAVLVFHLLFMGRHPFIGRFLGHGNMPPEKAIREYRFAYGRQAAQRQMACPPHTLSLDAVSPELASLFERAFSQASSQSTPRPSAEEWGKKLTRFEMGLQKCAADPGHKIAAHLKTCPWCELMGAGGPNYFVTVAIHSVRSAAGAGAFVLAVVWRQIEEVKAPKSSYQRPRLPPGIRLTPNPLPPHFPAKPPPYSPAVLPEKMRVSRTFLQKAVGWAVVAAIILLLSLWCAAANALVVITILNAAIFGWWWAMLEGHRLVVQKQANAGWEEAYRSEQRREARHKEELSSWHHAAQQERVRRQQNLQSALEALARAEHHWQQEADKYYQSFSDAKAKLEELKKSYESLNSEYRAEHQQLQRYVREAQLKQFLHQRFISDAQIQDIGPVRKAALRSYGIETAFDVRAANGKR